VQNAVDAKTHAGFVFIRLDVNVAGAAVNRLEENLVDQLYYRRLVGDIEQVFSMGPAAGVMGVVATVQRLLEGQVVGVAADSGVLIVTAADARFDFGRRTGYPPARPVQNGGNGIVSLDVERVRQGDCYLVVVHNEGNCALLLKKLQRQSSYELRIELLGRYGVQMLYL